MDQLKEIPIIRVAEHLGIPLVKTGAATWCMKDETITSLTIFEKTNSWHRFSGKTNGGVSSGSNIDLVMHIRNCDLKESIQLLTNLL